MNLANPLAGWIERGTARRAVGETWPATLGRAQVFILPSGFGLLVAAAVLVMLLIALNYQNSAVFLLAFLLGALFLVAMVSCHQHLRGLVVTGAHIHPVFAGEPARLALHVINRNRRPRNGLACQTATALGRPIRIDANSAATLALNIEPRPRGRHTLRHLTLTSREPFGVFRAWSRFSTVEYIVYPRPAPHAPPPPGMAGLASLGTAHHQPEDFLGLARYRPGDRPGQIAWPVYARRDILERKDFGGAGGGAVWLDFKDVSVANIETKLSILCAWVLAAERGGADWGLRLPGYHLAPGRGHHQLERALATLALYPGPYPA